MAEKRYDNNGRVLRNGELQRKSDGRYLYRYLDAVGNRITVYAPTLAELREKEKQIERDQQDGIDHAKGNMTLNVLFEIYMDTKTELRESTRINYIAMWKSLVAGSTIGNMKIANIKQLHIKSFYSDLVRRGLADNTIKLCHNLIFPALEMAVDSDMIRKNPAKGCRKNTGGTKTKREAMTVSEQNAMMDFIHDSDLYCVYEPMIGFALCTGLRIGELAGLSWSDVDLKKDVVHIRRQLIYKNLGDGCMYHIRDLKTEAGERDIPLTEQAKSYLQEQKRLCIMLGKAFVRYEVDGVRDFVFTNTNGKPYATNAVNFVLNNIVKAYNKKETDAAVADKREAVLLPHISAHILRHTACTRFVESGLEPKIVQYIMGHANIAITLDTYTHIEFPYIEERMKAVQDNIRIG